MKLDVQQLRKLNACAPGIAALLARSGGTGVVDYQTWTADDSARVWSSYGEHGPKFIAWLETRGMIPILEIDGAPSVDERRRAVEAATSRRAFVRMTIGPKLSHKRKPRTLFERVNTGR
jgi:hypothetical protein